MAYWCGSSKHPVSVIKEELVIVLLGSDADVKASCGNTILGRNLSSESERHDGMVLNRRVVIINTPDLKKLILSPEEQSLKRYLHLAFPGLHAILLVLDPGSLTDLKGDELQKINLIFGAGASEYVIVVFMHEEQMKDESVTEADSRSEETPVQIWRRPHHHLQRNGDQSQVLKLLEDIENMVEKNGGHQLKVEKNVSQRRYSLSLDFIMWYDRRSQVFEQNQRRTSEDFEHPNMCDLRVVLLGKNDSENHRVRNSFLREHEKPASLKWENVMRISGRVKDRHVTVIDTLHLLQTNISDHQITQTVRECVYLSHPGPHVFILVLQYRDFTEEDMRRAKHVLKRFSEEAMKRTIIITTDEETHTSPLNKPPCIHQLVKACEGRHLQLNERKPEWPSEILSIVDMILVKVWENKENYLTCNTFQIMGALEEEEEEEEQSRSDEPAPSEAENKKSSQHKDDGNLKESQKRRSDEAKKNLNLVLCGSETTLMVSVSKRLRGKKIKPSQHRTVNELCVRKAEKIHGHTLSVVELPALSRLSEEEVMRQTLHCVSLCQPGVHAFIFIVPDAPLNNDEKSEIEKIQEIFDSREHFLVLFISDHPDDTLDSMKHSSESQSLISRCGGQYCVMGLNESENSRQIPDLLDYIKNMKTGPYSPQMFVKAQEKRVQLKMEEKHKKELREMENYIKELKGAGSETDVNCLRIVLIGRTGNGKSATGNTILGRNEFVSQISSDSVTTVCEKGVGEVDGRSVAVVDTPGLFDTTLKNDQLAKEIMKCVSLSSPGPHVFVIVLSLGRFTKEETDTLDLIKKIFGPKAAQFSIVLFTRGDDLQGESIEDYVRESKSAELKKLIRDCGNRFVVFNNREKTEDRTQVIQLINMIEEVKNTNQGRHFTNSVFEEAEMSIKKKMEEILKEREREVQTQGEALKVKYDRVMEDMTKRFEKEKQKAEDEIKKMEKHFREKEENLRKELKEKEETKHKEQETEYQKLLEEEKLREAEYQQKIEKLRREIENQRSAYEKQQKQREEEDQKREEKYRRDQEKMKNEHEHFIEELRIKHHDEIQRKDLQNKQKNEEEEEERRKWRRRIKEAENERKEIQEDIKRQQREWEEEKKRQMREREEEERKRKEKHEEELREKQEELEKMRKRFEREREEERHKIEEERQKQRREMEEKEREYEERKREIKRYYEQLERERKEEWERRKQEEEERREEEKRMLEDLKQKHQEEIKRKEAERRRREEREIDEIKQKHEEEMKEMKKTLKDQARKQLKEHQKQHEILEKLYQHLNEQKGEEIKELQKQVEELKNKPDCAVL